MTRTLVLKREALTALSDDDLTGVVGGIGYRITESGFSCGIRPCEVTDPSLPCVLSQTC